MPSVFDAYQANAKHYEINNALSLFGPNTEAIVLIFIAICIVTLIWKFF